MPVEFSSLPPFLQQQVINEMDSKDIATLIQSSKVARATVPSVRCLATKVVNRADIMHINQDIYICFHSQFKRYQPSSQLRIIANAVSILHSLTPQLCGKVLDFVCKSGSTFSELRVKCEDSENFCSQSSLNELIEAADVKKLTIGGNLRDKTDDYILSLPDTITDLSFHGKVGNDVFKAIKAHKLNIGDSHIDNIGLNSVLKEWFAGMRNIDDFNIKTHSILMKEVILNGLPYAATSNRCVYKIHNGSDIIYVKITSNGTFQAANSYFKTSNFF